MTLVHESHLEALRGVLVRRVGKERAAVLLVDMLPILEEIARERIYREEEKYTGEPFPCVVCGIVSIPLDPGLELLKLCSDCAR